MCDCYYSDKNLKYIRGNPKLYQNGINEEETEILTLTKSQADMLKKILKNV